MKTSKLLAALAIPAMFAACTNEDILVESSQAYQEVKGAELVGSGISINVSDGGIQSRLVNEGGIIKFTDDDRVGLGWLINGNDNDATKVQDPTKGPGTSKVWANHLFIIEDNTTNTFVTKGNVYAGWHYAYYPFAYQKQPGSILQVNLNPDQGTMDYNERYSQNLHLSARQFITFDDLDENLQLKKSFKLYNTVNNILIKTQPAEGSAFVEGGEKANLAIKSITIEVGQEVFTDTVDILAYYLNEKTEGEEGDVISADVRKEVFKYTYAEGEKGKRKTFLTTNLTDELSETTLVSKTDNRLMPIALQVFDAVEITKENVEISIEAGLGKFVIKYVEDAEEGSPAAINNEVIEKLVAAYAEGGAMTQWTNWVQLGTVQLYNDIYTVEYNNIMNIDDWNEAVATANALGEESPIFTLGENAEIIFTSEEGITAPEKGVNVVSSKDDNGNQLKASIVIDGEMTWNEAVNIDRTERNISVIVNENAKLYVEDAILEPYKLYNKGTIYVDATSTVGYEQYPSLRENNRIEVEYGAYVYLNGLNGKEGTIAFEVPADWTYNMINNVISDSNNGGEANVNTLIINENITLECYKSTTSDPIGSDGDRYNPSAEVGSQTSTTYLSDLTSINLEINGGEIKCGEDPQRSYGVNNVKMNGGKVTNVNINGSLEIESGDVTIENETTGNVTITEGTNTITTGTMGDLTILDGSNTITAESANTMTVKGTNELNINNITGDVQAEGTTTINNAEITGDVQAEGTTTINNAEITGDVTVDGETVLTDVNIYGTLTNENGITITGENNVEIYAINNKGTMTVENNVYVQSIDLRGSNSTTIDAEKAIYYTSGYEQGGTTTGRIVNLTADQLSELIEAGGDVTLPTTVNLETVQEISNEVTINLNGKGINAGAAMDDQNQAVAILAKDGAELTIDGNGYVYGGNGNAFNVAVRANGNSKVTIKNGVFSVGKDNTESIQQNVIYATENAEITIEGGEFKVEGNDNNQNVQYLLNIKDDARTTAKIIVKGGTFYGFNPANVSEGSITSFVADGYTSTETETGIWVVTKSE